MSSRTNERLNTEIIMEMGNNQFPFGECQIPGNEYRESRKVMVRKRILYRTPSEKLVLENKLNILKQICHRNVINLKTIEEYPLGGYSLYYNYVPLMLQTAFEEIDQETFKQLHKQIIHLAIHLAKNYILTSFNSNRCGVVFVDGKFIIKYYLPLNQIVITQSISMLERSVQLFKVQAMHLLDTLRHHDHLTISSATSLQLNLRYHSPKVQRKKNSENLIKNYKTRKLSTDSFKDRRFSHLQDTFNQLRRKKSQDSTNITDNSLSKLKNALKTIRLQSQRKRILQRSRQKIKIRVDLIRIRSSKILKIFDSLKKERNDYIALSRLLTLCNQL